MGTNTDFQVSEHGNLHINPRRNGNTQAVAIGFFDDPSNNTDPLIGTFLDVGKGRTRLRQLPAMKPNTLVIGYRFEDVNEGPEDYFLGRLDFPEENPECFVLNGEGQWVSICEGILDSDCRWSDIPSVTIPGEKDIRTGYDPDEDECYRGKVSIGDWGVKDSKLTVINTSFRDKVKTGISVYSLVSNLPENIGVGISANSWGYPQNNLANTYFGVMGHGGQGSTTSGKFNIGVYGRGIANQNGISFGTYATASGGLPNNNIAVYAEANVALYTVGAVVNTGPPIYISDESIKTNVQDVLNPTEILRNCCAQNGNTSPKNNNKNLENRENQGVILHQNVPNPFSHGTRIEFELPQSENVVVEISDARGMKVITLVRATLDEGLHSYWWDAQDTVPGIYFYSLFVNGKLLSKKMIRL